MISPSEIKSVPWVKEKERAIDIAIESFYVIGEKKEYFQRLGVSLDIRNHLALSSGKLYFDSREMQAAKDYVLKQKSVASWGGKVTKAFITIAERCEKSITDIPEVSVFRTWSGEKLAAWYEAYSDSIYSLIPYSCIVSMVLENAARELIVKELSKQSKDPERLYQNIIVAEKPNTTNLEYRERLELACLFEKFGERFPEKARKQIDSYLKNFCWLHYYRPIDIPVTEEKLILMLREVLSGKKPEVELERIKNMPDARMEASRILSRLDLSSEIRSLIEVMQKNVWIRTYRRELMSHAFYLAKDFYTVAAEKLSTSRDDFRHVACFEVPEILRSGSMISADEMKRREVSFALIRYNNEVRLISGDDVNSYNSVIEHKAFDPKELKGKVVFPGGVTGPVKIVRTTTDAALFKSGDILVAPTVAVWMTSIVEKCAGIITDEGGVLSHTAVVAREFRKPCIVGTLHATDALSDAMVITLDADKGLIIP